ncbi:MAG: PEP-CTERM sorting domain-containing protein [Candidatus Omnitrophota bacterium]
MLKKALLASLVLMLSVFFAADKSWAAAGSDGWGFWATDKENATPKNSFTWDERPFSYFFVEEDFFDTVPDNLDIKIQGFYEDTPLLYTERVSVFPWSESYDEGGDFRIWTSPDYWDSIKKHGDWKMKVVWRANIDDGWTGYRYKNYIFTITPEPLSSLLFLFGGISLAAARRKKIIRAIREKG